MTGSRALFRLQNNLKIKIKKLAYTLNERIIRHMGGNNANHRASRLLELESKQNDL